MHSKVTVECLVPVVNFYSTISIPNAQVTLWKKGKGDCKSQRIRDPAAILCLLDMTEKLHPLNHNNAFTQTIAT